MSDDRAVLIDIAGACQLVTAFLKDRSKNEFLSNMMMQSAVLHQLLVLGEAVRRLTHEFRLAHPETDWRGFAGLRDVLIHQYDNVDLELVWKIASEEVPDLKRDVDTLASGQAS
jgi:uncharacterized protein with HEPN domain